MSNLIAAAVQRRVVGSATRTEPGARPRGGGVSGAP